MARPSKTSAIDYTAAHDLTHGLLERAACPVGLPFVLVRDADKKGLRLRVTKAGGKYWQFETRVKGKLFTRALGGWPAVSIDDAKAEAHRLRGMTEQGTDPRDSERQMHAETIAATAAAKSEAIAASLTFGEAWSAYVTDRKPYWGEWQYQDQLTLGDAGGLRLRGNQTTDPCAASAPPHGNAPCRCHN
ncbi:MAG: DUF4102 domain-containing protein [Betaproteobacteria bacterium]|nr:DUF4102 domain-containing protein [Betaproteobacteria bacterium]